MTLERMGRHLVGLITVAALAAPLSARPTAGTPGDEEDLVAGAPATGRGALVGQWRLDPDLSEDPREKMRQAMRDGRRGGGGGVPGDMGGGRMPPGGMGGRGMGRGGGPRGGPGRTGEEGRRPPLMAFFEAKEITVTNVEPAVAILEPDGLLRTLQPDGGTYEVEHGEGRVRARWMDDVLEVETTNDRGKVKESWSVSPETGQLTVVLDMEPKGPMPPLSVRRVYDRVVEGADRPQ